MEDVVKQPERLTVKQVDAAEMIGVTVRTLHRWEKLGMLKGERRGGVKLYPYNDVRKLAGVADGNAQ